MDNPHKKYLDDIHNQMVDNLEKSIKVPFTSTSDVRNIKIMTKEKIEAHVRKLVYEMSIYTL